MRSKAASNWLIFQSMAFNHQKVSRYEADSFVCEYRSPWPTFSRRKTIPSHWCIIWKYDIHPWNTLQDMKQIAEALNIDLCDLQDFIIKSITASQWFVIQTFDLHPWHTLQDMRQQSMGREIYVNVSYIYDVNLCVTLNHYPQVWWSSIKYPSRYRVKSLNHEI